MSDFHLVTHLPPIPQRKRESHKGQFGRVLVVAGSADMSGAAILCGQAALRGGAGLVRVAVPAPIRPLVAAANPCYMTAALPATEAGQLSRTAIPLLKELMAWADVIAFGPGLGVHADVEEVLAMVLQENKAVVIDADGLTALAQLAKKQPKWQTRATLILTPHPGEAARLHPEPVPDRTTLARTLADRYQAVVVLKGWESIVTDGARVYVNPSGNPGMATGGTGDVLTGLIAGLWGQPMAAFDAAQLATHLHGVAGDLAADKHSELALIASDLLTYFCQAVRHHPGG